jgi:hypothetical protein
MCVCIYIYIHTYIHTHTHLYQQRDTNQRTITSKKNTYIRTYIHTYIQVPTEGHQPGDHHTSRSTTPTNKGHEGALHHGTNRVSRSSLSPNLTPILPASNHSVTFNDITGASFIMNPMSESSPYSGTQNLNSATDFGLYGSLSEVLSMLDAQKRQELDRLADEVTIQVLCVCVCT